MSPNTEEKKNTLYGWRKYVFAINYHYLRSYNSKLACPLVNNAHTEHITGLYIINIFMLTFNIAKNPPPLPP